MGVRPGRADPDEPFVFCAKEGVCAWVYGTLIADHDIRALLCRLMDDDMIAIEGPYDDGTVMIYSKDFGLREFLEGALRMRELGHRDCRPERGNGAE